MARLTALLGLAAVVSQASAHFLLNYPATSGKFDEDTEGNAPCGGATIDFSTANITDFHVDGDYIALTNGHAEVTYLFRATLNDTTANNWITLGSPVKQIGLNTYCQPSITVPSSFAGSRGVIGVAADSPDGILYQCAAVSFVTGSASATPTACKNATGVQAAFTSDAALSSLPASATATASETSGSASASSSKSAAAAGMGPMEYGALGSLAWAGTVAAAGFAAFLL
ncbi:gpi anchored protein [Rutstroemia sp. NJR-2017a WRK4]|nr:gpi anchored protein [Rutstroemia sp. NJR-2017a WRK4]